MKELTVIEIENVSGAGFIQNALSNVGGLFFDMGYQMVSSSLSITLPIVGTISIGTVFPELGLRIGQEVGNVVGRGIEGALARIPIIGGGINKILGN